MASGRLWKVLLCLLPLSVAYNFSLIEKVLRRARLHHNITNIPIFVGNLSAVDRDGLDALYAKLSEDQQALLYNFDSGGDSSPWNILRNHIKHDTLSIVLCASSEDRIWKVVSTRLRKLRQTKVIVWLPPNAVRQELAAVFQRLWRLQFLHVVLISGAALYRYTPYPQLSFFPASPNGSEDLFPPIGNDLRGYVVSTPVENDLPRIFCITDKATGRLIIRGFGYRIFTNFLRRMNATLRISNPQANRTIMESVNMSRIVHEIGMRKLEITVHPYTGIDERLGILGYPIFKVHMCLIIPVRNEIPRYMYLLRPFDWTSWLLIVVAIVYVSFILVWSSPPLQLAAPFHGRLSRAFLDSIAQVLFLTSVMQIRRPGWRYWFVFVLLAVLGFFVTTWYSNLLSSFLTTFLVGQQIDTFEDLMESRFPVMVKSYEKHLLLEQVPPAFVAKIERQLTPAAANVQMMNLWSFNTSYAYPVTEERWRFLMLQQQFANKPIYRYSRLCFGTPWVGYPMRMDSHLEHPMTQFIMDVQMAGLDNYWLVSDFNDALKAGYVRLIDNIMPFKALDLNSLRAAWCLAAGGWLIGTIVFSIELLWERYLSVSLNPSF